MDRIKFYSPSDWACGYNLEKLENVLQNYDVNKKQYNINDIIELFNITLYIDNECFLIKWSEEKKQEIKYKNKELKRTIGKYCSEIDDNNIIVFFNEIDKGNLYFEDFFKMLGEYNVFERITEEKIKELLQNDFVLYLLLKNKKIVSKYGNAIKNTLLENPNNATILLDKYEIADRKSEIYLPQELSKDEKERLLVSYINSEEANINYLRIIENIQSSKDGLVISDKTRLLTKKKIKEQTEKIFKDNNGMKMETLVEFCHKRQKEEFKIEVNGSNIKCSYDLNWIKDNLDYPTLLNNFIYLFFYVDMQMRITLTSKESNLGLFERYISLNSKKAYKKGIAFDRLALLSELQMMGYYERLNELNIRLETIIEWFFREYLKMEFNINNFRILIPSDNATTLEKCRTILSEMDHILKEYQLIVEDGSIDHELLEISSNPIPFKDIKTLVKKKYIYECSDECKTVQYYFFSDQCMLHYVKRIDKSYNSFFDLINNERIKKEDYNRYAESEVNYLLEHDYLVEDNEGYLKINKKITVMLFKDLYINEVISYWKYPKKYRERIDKLVEDNIFCIKDSLLSDPEIDYFNYYLNKSEFNNGLDLRNKYIHGTQPSGEDAEHKHKHNYMIFLKLFILLIIKINDDICIYNSKEYQLENENKQGN